MIELNDAMDSIQRISMSKRKESEDFLQTLREWAQVEEIYAERIERISSHKGFNPRICEYFLNLKSYASVLSRRSKDLANKLNGYIIIHYKDLLTTQSYTVKSSYLEGKKMIESMRKKKNLVNDFNNKYINFCRDCEQLAFDLDKETSNAKREKNLQKLLTMKKEAEEQFELYTNALKDYNSSIEAYDESIAKVIDTYNNFEENRCKGFEESLKILYESLESSLPSFN